MGIIKNKYVNKFISGGNTPAFPPSHAPGEPATTRLPPEARSLATSEASLPPGWYIQWDPNAQKIYYLEQASGRTQWVPPVMSNDPVRQNAYSDDYAASILSGTTAHAASIRSDTTAHSIKPGNKLYRALQWRALPSQDRVEGNHLCINLPTKQERETIMGEAAEKRKKEGPPKPESFVRKTMRKVDEAGEFVGRSSAFGGI